MKTTLYSLLAAAACGMALGQTAYTTPVGYVSLGNVPGPAIPADTDFYFSLPLDRAAVFTGLVASVGTPIVVDDITYYPITLQGSPGLNLSTGGPHVVKLTSGSKEGLYGLVHAHTANSVTVAASTGEVLSALANGDGITIQEAWTPSRISTANSLPVSTQLLGFTGTAAGLNQVSDITYEFDGTNWTNLTTFASGNDDVIFPGEALIIRTVPSSPVSSFVLSGTVNTFKSRVVISNLDPLGHDNFVSYVAPVGDFLDLASVSTGANVGDQILLIEDPETNGVNVTTGTNKSASFTLEYQGSGNWLNLSSFQNVQSTFVLPAGQSFIYRVAAGAPSTDRVWSDLPQYVPVP